MTELLEKLRDSALEAIARARESSALEDIRVKYLGKKGELTAILKQMGALPPDLRPVMGSLANTVRDAIEGALSGRVAALGKADAAARLERERIDVTLPAKAIPRGSVHPMSAVFAELEDIFTSMGFSVESGPDVEYAYVNFTALNMKHTHPARDARDTFYVDLPGIEGEGCILRTQTSGAQIRTMLASKPPIRMVCPGRVFRCDEIDATHSPMFHQFEGLVVDRGINMGHLKSTLEHFASAVFGPETRLRFRPHHFPYTEPSAEVDVSCYVCGGTGCRVCKGEGWIELLGCGMVHPAVLRGCGIDRITMVKHGIDDMRLLFENDVRFLKQFS